MIVPFIRDYYDIVIIGAGPAGLNAGMHLIGCNASVLLVDKTIPWKQPIPCAEGVGKLGFEEALQQIKPSWIRHEISSASFHAPDGTVINYTDKNGGYIINRTLMQQDMAEQLSESTIDCAFNFQVSSISRPESGIRHIAFTNRAITSTRIVIDASGPIAGFGKDEKIACKPQDLEPAYFVWVDDIDIELDRVHIYTGSQIAPGGYAWVFPRESGSANIGIVIGKKYVKTTNIRLLLDGFLESNFPSAKIVRKFAGSIPCHFKKGPIAIPGFIKAGDAASTINPISRAGISEALLSGKLASQCALNMLDLKHSWEFGRVTRQYENLWDKYRGKCHTKLAHVKNSLNAVPDRDYIEAAKTLSQIPQDELTMSKIFKASLGRFPRLVWAMRHLM